MEIRRGWQLATALRGGPRGREAVRTDQQKRKGRTAAEDQRKIDRCLKGDSPRQTEGRGRAGGHAVHGPIWRRKPPLIFPGLAGGQAKAQKLGRRGRRLMSIQINKKK